MSKKTESAAEVVETANLESERIRFHENYFGMQAATFTCPNEFELTERLLRFSFDSWTSIDSFERGDSPVTRLKKEFFINDDFEQTKADNPFFADLLDVALKICKVGGRGYTVKRLFLSAVGKFLTVDAESKDGGDQPRANKYLNDYDQIISENLEIIGQIVGFMIVYGKTHDDFLANSSLIN